MINWDDLKIKIYKDETFFYYIGQHYKIFMPRKVSFYPGFKITDVVKPIEDIDIRTLEELDYDDENSEFLGADWWIFTYILRDGPKPFSVGIKDYGFVESAYSEKTLNEYFLEYTTGNVTINKKEKNLFKFSWKKGETRQIWKILSAYFFYTQKKIRININELILDEVDLIEALRSRTSLTVFLSDEDYSAKRTIRIDLE